MITEARGGVVIARNVAAPKRDTDYFGIRLYIETLTVNRPLHDLFGEPHVRSAYARAVYRYEVTRRDDVLKIALFLSQHVYDKTRRAELNAAITFCRAATPLERSAALVALTDTRVGVN